MGQKSVLGGAMIAAGTMIGAGMLSLPIMSAGMWFNWTVFIMLLTVLFMYTSAEQILEVNLNYQPGASFDTLVKDNLGRKWNIINGLSVSFVLYILLYAYIVGSGSVISETMHKQFDISISNASAGLVFSVAFTFIVWFSTKAVDRLSTILMVGMFLTLFAALFGLLDTVDPVKLFQPTGENRYAIYAFASLPFFLTSFCFHASVPSLVKYYGVDAKRIRKCIFYGMLITFVFYFFWIFATMGNVERELFQSPEAKTGNIDSVLWLLGNANQSSFFGMSLRLFSFFAVVTSFLGAGLGLFDYIADLFNISNNHKGRLITALITFLPPTIGGMFFPNGFVLAIGYAGLFAAIWSVIVPGLMVMKFRRKQARAQVSPMFKPFGGKLMPLVIIIYGTIAAVSHIFADIFKVLPVF